MRIAGIIFLAAGILGLLFFGYQAIDQSEAFNFLGMEIAVSSADWTPVIISGVVTVAGIILISSARKRG